jgi:hypothetical protein
MHRFGSNEEDVEEYWETSENRHLPIYADSGTIERMPGNIGKLVFFRN